MKKRLKIILIRSSQFCWRRYHGCGCPCWGLGAPFSRAFGRGLAQVCAVAARVHGLSISGALSSFKGFVLSSASISSRSLVWGKAEPRFRSRRSLPTTCLDTSGGAAAPRRGEAVTGPPRRRYPCRTHLPGIVQASLLHTDRSLRARASDDARTPECPHNTYRDKYVMLHDRPILPRLRGSRPY